MKTFILSAVAATLVAAPLTATPAVAQQRSVTTVEHDRGGRTVTTTKVVNHGPRWRTWRAGDRFDRNHAHGYREITTYRDYRLAPPPRGHRWVRSGRDAVLVAPDGTVRTIRRGAFR